MYFKILVRFRLQSYFWAQCVGLKQFSSIWLENDHKDILLHQVKKIYLYHILQQCAFILTKLLISLCKTSVSSAAWLKQKGCRYFYETQYINNYQMDWCGILFRCKRINCNKFHCVWYFDGIPISLSRTLCLVIINDWECAKNKMVNRTQIIPA